MGGEKGRSNARPTNPKYSHVTTKLNLQQNFENNLRIQSPSRTGLCAYRAATQRWQSTYSAVGLRLMSGVAENLGCVSSVWDTPQALVCVTCKWLCSEHAPTTSKFAASKVVGVEIDRVSVMYGARMGLK